MLLSLMNGGIETAFNHLIKKTPKVELHLAKLKGKVLGIKLQKKSGQLYLLFSPQRIDVLQHYEGDIDCQLDIKTSLLFRFPKKSELSQYINDKSIILNGDLQVLQDFVALLDYLEKDPAELLSPYVGDVIAQSAVDFVQRSIQFCSQKKNVSQRFWGERLTEEWQLISPSLAIADFVDQVKILEKETALFEQKLTNFMTSANNK